MNKKIKQKLIFDVSNDVIEVFKKHGVSGGFFVSETTDIHVPDSGIMCETISYAEIFASEKTGISFVKKEEATFFEANELNEKEVIGFIKGSEQGIDSLVKKLENFVRNLFNGISK